MANIQVADTKEQAIAIKANNALTEIMTNSKSWVDFMGKMPKPQQKQIVFDVYAYVNRHTDTVPLMQPAEFMAATIECYSRGCTLQEGGSYILPFKGKATFCIGYQDMVRLATETGLFKYFDCVPVIKESIERFDYRRHVPIFKNDYIPTGKEKIIGYLAVSETHDGMVREIYHPVEWFEQFARKKSPQSAKAGRLTGVWLSDFDAMCKKTALKQLAKLAPKRGKLTEQQESTFDILQSDDEPQDERPPYIDVDGVVVNDVASANDTIPDEIDLYDIEPEPPQDEKQTTKELVCNDCGKKISEKVYDFSCDRYDIPLCMDCQKKHNA